jgi:hypothetical protein
MEFFLNDLWEATRPASLTLIAGLAPILATWLTARIVAKLNVEKDSELALSLGRTINSTLNALLQSRGISANTAATGPLIADAISIVKRDNPKAVQKHAPTDDQLATKILGKLREIKVAEDSPTVK